MVQDREAVYAAYVSLFTRHMAAQKTHEEAATLAAAFLTAGIAFEAKALGTFGAAERLRDLADEVERNQK